MIIGVSLKKSFIKTVVVYSMVVVITFVCNGQTGIPQQEMKDMWYTQIGTWHKKQYNILNGTPTHQGIKSFLYHNALVDGITSGEATACVRLNFSFDTIRRFEASIELDSTHSKAGLLIQNKIKTYYFYAKKGQTLDTLSVLCLFNNKISLLKSGITKLTDTTRLITFVKNKKLYFGTSKFLIWIPEPSSFNSLTALGFECPKGGVKVYSAYIESKNAVVNTTFENATLINLHLEKFLVKNNKHDNQN